MSKPVAIRTALLLWFVALTAALLVGFSTALYLSIRDSQLEALDFTLRARAEALAALCEWEGEHVELDHDESKALLPGKGHTRTQAEILTWPQGTLIFRSDNDAAGSITKEVRQRACVTPPGSAHPPRRRYFDHENPAGEARRTLAMWWHPPTTSPGVLILVSGDLSGVHHELSELLDGLALAAALTLTIAVAAGWLFARRIAGPLGRLARAASEVRAGARAEIPRERRYREIDELAGVVGEAFERLQEAYTTQARFSADASHELRTPLAVILSNAEVALRRPREADEYRRSLVEVVRGAERMSEILEHLLLLARADAGRLELHKQELDLAALAAEVVAAREKEAAGAGVAIELEAPAPAWIEGDGGLLTILISNLLANAIRYSDPPGAIRICIESGAEEIVLSVSDEGIGIPQRDLPHLFERFFRVDDHRSRASGGSGLGLSIVATIAAHHRARCTVQSEPGAGTTVRVHFPAARAARKLGTNSE